MESEGCDNDDQCGSNAEVTCLSKKVDIINEQREEPVTFTVLSDDTLVVLNRRQLVLYKSKKGTCRFENINDYTFFSYDDNGEQKGSKATTLTNIGSTKLVVLCDEFSLKKDYEAYTSGDLTDLFEFTNYRYSLINVFSIENNKLRSCFDMKTDVKKTNEVQQMRLAYDNEKLAILMTNPLKLELLNMNSCLSESVNMTSFATEMFPVGDGKPFLTMSNADGQTYVYISIAAGGGMRKLTKIDTNGHILATFVEINDVKPGPIASVGDGTLVFGYDGKLMLLSENLKILATLKTGIDVEDMEIHQTKKGRQLYCLTRNKITQYSLQ